jgi:DNA modification methylase
MILAGCPAGGIVLDPFVGSGTTVMVANELGRRGIGLDLNMKYLDVNARERLASVQPLIFA